MIILFSRTIRKSEKNLKDLILTKTDLSQKVGFKVTEAETNSHITFTAEMLEFIETSAWFVQDKVVEAKKCIEELDVDKDGQVSYPEFLLVWKFRD